MKRLEKVLVIICTYNEPGILYLLSEIYELSTDIQERRVDILVVDDSDDGITVKDLNYFNSLDSENRFRFIHRTNKKEKGLGSAILAGLNVAVENYYDVAIVMDGDGQHPPYIIPKMLERGEYCDLVLPSRFIKGGKTTGLDGPLRNFFSLTLRWIPKLIFYRKLKRVSDPLGGFFLVRVNSLRLNKLSPGSWKMLLEVILFSKWNNISEIPYTFALREKGESKMTTKEALIFFKHILELTYRYYFKNEKGYR